jgi:hypothetical protein
MKRQFSCELYAPSIQQSLRFNELAIKYLKNIIKYIQNKDDHGLCDYFTELLDHLYVDENNSLDRLDKFCILLGLRIICIGPSFEMQFTCKKTSQPFKYKLDLVSILQKIINLDLYSNNIITIDDNITVELGFPTKFTYPDHDEIVFECLSTVNIKDNSFDIKLLTKNERENILAVLPSTISNDIIEYVNEKQKILNDIVFMDVKSPFNPEDKAVKIQFNAINNTFMEILKGIYGINIDELYNLIYILTSKLKFSAEYIENNMTYAEAIVYITKYTTELKEQEEAHKKRQTSNHSAAAGTPVPMQVPYTGIE